MSDPDDALRRLIADSVDSLEPADRLDRIRARTGRRRGRLLVPIAVAATLLVAGGTTYLLLPREGAPVASTPAAQPEGPTSKLPWRALPVYYAGSPDQAAGEQRLFREFRRGNGSDVVSEAVQAAVGEQPVDPDYRSLWPAGTTASAEKWDGEALPVVLGPPTGTPLRGRPAGMSDETARLAVQQVVYTAQAAHGVGRVPVRLLVDGAPVDQVLGVPTGEPLLNAPADEVVAPVNLTRPEQDVVVGGTRLHLEGRVTDEIDAVTIEIVRAADPGSRPLVAKRIGPLAGDAFRTFSATLPLQGLANGDYTLRAVSARERPYEDTKQFTIRRAR